MAVTHMCTPGSLWNSVHQNESQQMNHLTLHAKAAFKQLFGLRQGEAYQVGVDLQGSIVALYSLGYEALLHQGAGHVVIRICEAGLQTQSRLQQCTHCWNHTTPGGLCASGRSLAAWLQLLVLDERANGDMQMWGWQPACVKTSNPASTDKPRLTVLLWPFCLAGCFQKGAK